MARIIIADDAMFMRETIKKILTDAGHEVVGEADNGKMALLIFQNTKPDIVILDITMPVMDGLTALSEMLRIDPSARVLICSALGQEQKIMESLQKGARDYLVKPFPPTKLIDAIKRLLAD